MDKLGEKLNAKRLQSRWNVKVRHALYREDGKWYMELTRFPAALFDYNGYVIFPSRESYISSPYLQHGKRLHVRGGGIADMPDYVRKRNESS